MAQLMVVMKDVVPTQDGRYIVYKLSIFKVVAHIFNLNGEIVFVHLQSANGEGSRPL